MADSRCCFGCSNVRKGAYLIAIFDMLICTLLIIRSISMVHFAPYDGYKQSHYSYGDPVVTTSHGSNIRSMENDFIIFTQLFVLFIFFYINLSLKKATYMHNAFIINHWLIMNTIFFILFVFFVGLAMIKNGSPEIIRIGLPISIVVVYQLYVVKCFYDDELKYTTERNAVTQPPYVTITSQTTSYPVQTGPYVIQQVHQPVTQAPYPQQTYQYQQQPSSQPQMVLPQPESHSAMPQEYVNPPPYSPNYTMQEGGTSVKQ